MGSFGFSSIPVADSLFLGESSITQLLFFNEPTPERFIRASPVTAVFVKFGEAIEVRFGQEIDTNSLLTLPNYQGAQSLGGTLNQISDVFPGQVYLAALPAATSDQLSQQMVLRGVGEEGIQDGMAGKGPVVPSLPNSPFGAQRHSF
eukprot:gene22587-biopygen8105